MSTAVQTVEVPDIGDFGDVPIIEILVSVGDTVAIEDPLVTLESDKATMDVPAPVAGVVKEIVVSLGDQVSQGTALMTIEGQDAAAAVDAVEPPVEASAAEPPGASAEASAAAGADRRVRGGAGPGSTAGTAAGRALPGFNRGAGGARRRRADLREPVGPAAGARARRRAQPRQRQRAQGADHQG